MSATAGRALPLVLCALLAQAAPAHPQSPVVGAWKLDKRRSELRGGMRNYQDAIEQVVTIEQDGPRLSVSTRTSGGPLGDVWDNSILLLDGREHRYSPPAAPGGTAPAGRRIASWLPDGSGFLVEERHTRVFDSRPVAVRSVHRWYASADGLTLTVESATSGPDGEIRSRRVFSRQRPPARA